MQQHLMTAWVHQPTAYDRRSGFVVMTRDEFDARVLADEAQDPRVGLLHLKYIKRPPPNAPPVNTLPAGLNTTPVDTPLPLVFAVADADSPSVTVRLQATVGTFHVGAGGTITGNDTGNVLVAGTVAEVNASIGAAVYTPGAGATGIDQITMTSSDGLAQDVDNTTVTVEVAALARRRNGSKAPAAPAPAPEPDPDPEV
jgi:hypothetical protein